MSNRDSTAQVAAKRGERNPSIKLSILGARVSTQAEALHSLLRVAETAPIVAMPDVLAVASVLADALELTGGEIATGAVLDPAGSAS